MHTPLIPPRGGSLTVASYVGPAGSIVVNTDAKTIHVHDGITAGGFALSKVGHQHTLNEITAALGFTPAALTAGGKVSVAQLGSGTANATKVLFGDGTWKDAPTGGGGGSSSSLSGTGPVSPSTTVSGAYAGVTAGVGELYLVNAAADSNEKAIQFAQRADGVFQINLYNDALNSNPTFFSLDRNGANANIATFNVNSMVVNGTLAANSYAGVGTALTALNASNLSSGTVPSARLGSGGASATTFLRGDGTWATPSIAVATVLNATGNRSFNATVAAVTAGISTDGTYNVPCIGLTAPNAPLNEKVWQIGGTSGGGFEIGGYNDALQGGSYSAYITIGRNGAAANLITLAATAINLNGAVTGTSFTGSGSGLTALNAGNLATGTVPTARLGSGAATASTYLRGDGTWATVSAGSVTSSAITTALGYTPADASNLDATQLVGKIPNAALAYQGIGTPSSTTFLSGDGAWRTPVATVTSAAIITALGYTPANAATGSVTSSQITTALGYTPADASNLDAAQLTGKIPNSALAYQGIGTPSQTTFLSGDGGWRVPVTNVTGAQINTALGYTAANQAALNASALTSGTVPSARLGTGTADATTYLRGDGTWSTPAGGGGGWPVTAPFVWPGVATAGLFGGSSLGNGNLVFISTTGSSNNRVFTIAGNGSGMTMNAVNDAASDGNAFFSMTRTGIVVNSVTLAATAINLTGAVTGTSFTGTGTGLTALNASNLGSGTVPTARLGTGTASASTYLRGDGTWTSMSASAGGSNTGIQYNSSGALAASADLTYDGTVLELSQPAASTYRNGLMLTVNAGSVQGTISPALVFQSVDKSNTHGSAAIYAVRGASYLGDLVFATQSSASTDSAPTEKFRISHFGGFSVNGSYGTAGQVLTSTGNAGAATWSNPSVTALNGTGAATFSTAVNATLAGSGIINLINTSVNAADNKAWQFDVAVANTFRALVSNDVNSAWSANWLTAVRSGNTITSITLAGTAMTMSGSGFTFNASSSGATASSTAMLMRTAPGGITSGASGAATYGSGDSVSGVTGAVILASGLSSTAGVTGNVTVASGNAGSGSASGSLTLRTGTCAGAGISGSVTLQSGDTATSSSGDVTIKAGTSSDNTTGTGHIRLTAGAGQVNLFKNGKFTLGNGAAQSNAAVYLAAPATSASSSRSLLEVIDSAPTVDNSAATTRRFYVAISDTDNVMNIGTSASNSVNGPGGQNSYNPMQFQINTLTSAGGSWGAVVPMRIEPSHAIRNSGSTGTGQSNAILINKTSHSNNGVLQVSGNTELVGVTVIASSQPALNTAASGLGALEVRSGQNAADFNSTGVTDVRIRSTGASIGRLLLQNSSTGTTTTDGLGVWMDGSSNAHLFNYEAGYLRLGSGNVEGIRVLATGSTNHFLPAGFNQGAPKARIHFNSYGSIDSTAADVSFGTNFYSPSGSTVTSQVAGTSAMLQTGDNSSFSVYHTTGIAADTSFTPTLRLRMEVAAGGYALRPGTDNSQNFGTSSFRWANGYFGALFTTSGTVSVSDERLKTDIVDLEDAEVRVAQQLKQLLKKYRLKSEVAAQGAKAKWHVGIIAQAVVKAFADEGLDAHDYAMLSLTDVDGVDQYGVNYDELLAFIIAAL